MRLVAKWPMATSVVALAVVALLSYLPHQGKQLLHTHGKLHLVGHCVVFAALAFFVTLQGQSQGNRCAWLFALAAFGATIELGQELLYSRAMIEWYDLGSDVIGIGGGIAVSAAVAKFRAREAGRLSSFRGRSRK